MDIRHLRYFIVIAQSRSMSAAAEQLRVAQPSLTQHIKRIEEELGVKLLMRSTRGVTVTEEGLKFLDHAREIVSRLDLAVSDIQHTSENIIGRINLGLPSITSHALGVPLIETIRHDFPKISLRVVEAMSGHVQNWLAEGVLDMALLLDVNELRHMQVRPLVKDRLYLIAGCDSWPVNTGGNGIADVPVTLRECSKLDLILSSRGHGLRETVERSARNAGLSLNTVLEVDSLYQIKHLVARGSGFTILPHVAIAEDVATGSLICVPISEPDVFCTTYLAIDPLRTQTRAGRCVTDTVELVVPELVVNGRWDAVLIEDQPLKVENTTEASKVSRLG
jgi:LysR family transcriptional regulator, nitrogen assimilation regulatory protein